KTDQLRQQLHAANQALATANTREQVQALTIRRQQLLDRIQADALIAQALTTETGSPSSLARLRRFLSGTIDCTTSSDFFKLIRWEQIAPDGLGGIRVFKCRGPAATRTGQICPI